MTKAAANLPVEDEDSPLTGREIRHFLAAPSRRPWLVLVPWVSVVLLSVAAFFYLPKRYESSTLILVESEKVPDSFVPKVATQDRTRRLEAIKPEILSRTRLEQVIEETQPYPEVSSKTQAVEAMRRSISIEVTGHEGFTLSFVHEDPHKAQEVVGRIAALFIEQTIKAREQQVAGAVDFLDTQVAAAREELEKKDEALRVFKEERMGRLPEQLQTNLATMSMLQRETQAVDESLFFAREKYDALKRRASKSPSGSPAASSAPAEDELGELRRQLVVLRSRRYTDEHPDVQSLRRQIARLEAQQSRVPAAREEGDAEARDLEPETRDQLQATLHEIENLEEKRAGLERRMANVRANIELTPRTEQELSTLTRDYEKLDENYVKLLEKQLEARMAGRLEQRWKGDRFRVLDPANLPEKPVFPKPIPVIGMGLLLGLCLGLAAALVAEFMDPTIKDAEQLQTVQDYPVLAVIPHQPGLGDSSW